MIKPGAAAVSLFLLGTAPVAAQQPELLTVRAEDGLLLHAALYRAPGRGPLVLLFHQCNRAGAETGYETLGHRLAAAGFHALALDSRGFGRSRNAEYPDFRSRRDETAAKWPGDIDTVLRHVAPRPEIDGTRLAAVGASCGVDQAIYLAGRREAARAVVALSGSLEPAAESVFAAMRPIPLFIAFADGDGYNTPASMRALFASARESRTRMLTYKGTAHGTPLLAEDPGLVSSLVAWLAPLLQASR